MERRNLTYEENKKANLLCVVSLVLMFAPLLLYCAGLEIADTYLNIDFTGSFAHLCTWAAFRRGMCDSVFGGDDLCPGKISAKYIW